MSTRVAIVDLDGTVYRGGSLIPGADRGIDRLREAGYELRFVSNSPSDSPAAYARKLRGMGIDVAAEHVVSSGAATTAALRERHPDGAVFLVGSTGLETQLRDGGVDLTDDPPAADALVVSWDSAFGYDDMVDALAVPEGVPFYGTDPDRTYPTESGGIEPGSGAVIGAVAATVGRNPDAVFGKPSLDLFEQAVGDADPADCLVVGDRLSTDIEMGERAGARTVLVRSGVTDGDALEASDRRPDHVIGGLADIGSIL